MILGPYHDYGNLLPQFTEPFPEDINQNLGFESINAENSKILFATAGRDNIPDELKHLPVEWDESIGIP